MNKYIITFEINGRPQHWERAGIDIETTLKQAKMAIEMEWPGTEPRKLNIYPVVMETKRHKYRKLISELEQENRKLKKVITETVEILKTAHI